VNGGERHRRDPGRLREPAARPGVLANGSGPTVLLRRELDALPLRETTGAPFASTVTDHAVPARRGDRRGRAGHGRRRPVHAHPRAGRRPGPALAARHRRDRRHVPGPFMSAADGIRVTVYGRGGHGSMPQHAVDPVVLAAMIVVRLQTVVSREVAPGDTAVVTVGSLQAGRHRPGSQGVRGAFRRPGGRDSPADRQRGLQQAPRLRSYPVLLPGHRVHRQAGPPRGREGRHPGRPAHQPLAGVPAPAPAHLANRYRGPRRGRAGLARTSLRPDTGTDGSEMRCTALGTR
jgi:hypothetical protein